MASLSDASRGLSEVQHERAVVLLRRMESTHIWTPQEAREAAGLLRWFMGAHQLANEYLAEALGVSG